MAVDIKEIEKSIAALPPDELEVLRKWFAGFVRELWQKEEMARSVRRGGRKPKPPHDRELPPAEAPAPHRRMDNLWVCYHQLPDAIRPLVDECFNLVDKDPKAPSLQLQKNGPVWSMNIGPDYKALALDANGRYFWYWVGPSDECPAPAK